MTRAVRGRCATHVERSLLVPLALAFASGCSLWNAPDRGRLDGGAGPDTPIVDAGVDAPILEDAPDAPMLEDAPDAPPPPRFERNCADMLDDDMDGFVDCADLDCAADVTECCTAGGTAVVNENWTTAGLAGWSRLPDLLDDGPNLPPAGQPLSQFSRGNTSFARAIIHDPAGAPTGCIAIDPGVVITTSLRLLSDAVSSCPVAECDERAGILLTAVQPATAVASYSNGDVLPDELGVRMRRSDVGAPSVEVTVAGNIVYTLEAGLMASDVIQVRIELVPGVSEDGTPVSITTVLLTLMRTGATVRALDREPAIARSLLLGPASGCAGGRGLYLAVEGVGNRVGVGPLQVLPQVCPNPNHFRALGAPLEAADLGATSAWTTGGAGAPSLFYADANAAPGVVVPRWDVLFDASDRNRANETFATVRFGVGGAFFADEAWTMRSARRGGAPLVDEGFPTCGGSCVESNRDPDIWLQTDTDRAIVGSTAWVTWSRRLGTGFWEILIDTLELTSAARIGSPAVLLSTDPTSGAALVSACTALRSPSLVGRPGSGLWLFFVCEHGGMPGDVRVAEVSSSTGDLESVMSSPVLTRGTAPYATLGIQDVDAEAWVRAAGTTNEEVVLRLWFVSRSGGLPVVGLAEGVSHAMSGATSAGLPTLSMFAGNPVLLSRDERLPTCAGLCRITSIAAARTADERDVRFLVALSDEAAGAPRHLLVPLEQTLPLR